MRSPWIPIVVGAVAGAIICVVLYPIVCAPTFVSGGALLERIGIVLAGVSGTVMGGLGASIPTSENEPSLS